MAETYFGKKKKVNILYFFINLFKHKYIGLYIRQKCCLQRIIYTNKIQLLYFFSVPGVM